MEPTVSKPCSQLSVPDESKLLYSTLITVKPSSSRITNLCSFVSIWEPEYLTPYTRINSSMRWTTEKPWVDLLQRQAVFSHQSLQNLAVAQTDC
jgi:hypothetical protein